MMMKKTKMNTNMTMVTDCTRIQWQRKTLKKWWWLYLSTVSTAVQARQVTPYGLEFTIAINLQLQWQWQQELTVTMTMVLMSKVAKMKLSYWCFHLHHPIGLQSTKVCHPTKHWFPHFYCFFVCNFLLSNQNFDFSISVFVIPSFDIDLHILVVTILASLIVIT